MKEQTEIDVIKVSQFVKENCEHLQEFQGSDMAKTLSNALVILNQLVESIEASVQAEPGDRHDATGQLIEDFFLAKKFIESLRPKR
jgi:hypothetical protein